jgi:hypothetical protein
MRKLQRFYTDFRALPGIVRFGILLALAILVMLVVPSGAKAQDRIARQGADSVTITDRPCGQKDILGTIGERVGSEFLAAHGRFGGKDYRACWRPLGPSAHIVYEDGDQGIVPLADFKPVLSI